MNQDELIEKCRLTPKQLKQIWDDTESYDSMDDWREKVCSNIAEAQLRKAVPLIEQEYEAECQKRVERIFEEIESMMDGLVINMEDYGQIGGVVRDINKKTDKLMVETSDWQSLKQREGVEK